MGCERPRSRRPQPTAPPNLREDRRGVYGVRTFPPARPSLFGLEGGGGPEVSPCPSATGTTTRYPWGEGDGPLPRYLDLSMTLVRDPSYCKNTDTYWTEETGPVPGANYTTPGHPRPPPKEGRGTDTLDSPLPTPSSHITTCVHRTHLPPKHPRPLDPWHINPLSQGLINPYPAHICTIPITLFLPLPQTHTSLPDTRVVKNSLSPPLQFNIPSFDHVPRTHNCTHTVTVSCVPVRSSIYSPLHTCVSHTQHFGHTRCRVVCLSLNLTQYPDTELPPYSTSRTQPRSS